MATRSGKANFNYLLVASTWTRAAEEITGELASKNGIMRLWKAEELADQAVQALSARPLGDGITA